MKVSTTIFILVALVSICKSQIIPVQSHSFNDIEYVAQQLIKGLDSFKMDVNAIQKSFCTKFSTWKEGDNECETDMYGMEICCLGFRGDQSSSPVLTDYFNNTNEFLSFLKDERLDFIWKKGPNRNPRYNTTIYWAFNTQYPILNGSLTKNWFGGLINIIKERDLDIQVILPYSTMANWFTDHCKSNQCDENATAIANYDFFVQSNDDSTNDPRVQQLNFHWSKIYHFCEHGFPSYGDKAPYFFWEFDKAKWLDDCANEFLGDKCKRRAGHETQNTIRYTSNIDQEQIQGFLPKNYSKIPMNNVSDTFTAELVANKYFFFAYYNQLDGYTYVEVREIQDENLISIFTKKLLQLPITKFDFQSPYLVLTQNQINVATAYQIDASNITDIQFNKLFNWDLSSPLSKASILYSKEASKFYFADTSIDNKGELNIKLFDKSGKQQKSFSHQLDNDQIDFSGLNQFDITFGQSSTKSTYQGLLVASINKTFFGYQTKPTLYSFGIEVSEDMSFSINQPKNYFDFGSKPHIFTYNFEGQLFILEVHTDGLAQSGHKMNNGNAYRCGIPTTSMRQRALLQSVPYTMNYNWGRYDDFIARIQSGTVVSACDTQIMHGKYGLGVSNTGVLYTNATDNSFRGLMINTHVQYNDLATVTRAFVGSPLPDKFANSNDIDVNIINLVDPKSFGEF